MKDRDYLLNMNPYIILDGIKNHNENHNVEQRIYEDIISDIEPNEKMIKTKNDIDDLLYETSKNYFCKGLKIGIEICMALIHQHKEFNNEEIE